MQEVEIEDNVPMPVKSKGPRGEWAQALAGLKKIGQSFFVEQKRVSYSPHLQPNRDVFYTAAKNAGIKVRVCITKKGKKTGLRVWRSE